ncbi:MAG: RHS repeat-associated core domain-containing protein [Candidatus Cryptobacteroides sp.]
MEENSFDPWGRLRNPETQEIYASGTEPELMLGRGFTGHEHLTWFGLINMNARLYDPVLGRFLSPDPYVQMPDFTQSFNRYSYCLNNPLVYVDENGEFVWFVPIIVGAIGGLVNLFANINNIEGFWDGLSTFAVGFGTGALAATIGGASIAAAVGIGAAAGALTSFNNELVAQTGANFSSTGTINWDNVWRSTFSGAIAGGASGAMGSWASSFRFTINGISSPVLNSAVTSSLAAGAGHIVGGTSYNLMSGQNFSEAFQNSLQGVWKSALMGGVIGAGTTYATCLATGVDPFRGVTTTAKDLHLEGTIDRIQNGESYPHRHDGTVFRNDQGYLPQYNTNDYYHEYVHPTAGLKGVGPQRIITGSRGEWYYSPDHYHTFIRFVL